MSLTLKVLGQISPSVTTETDLYVVPAATSTVVSTITVCNRSANFATFRISVSIGGGLTATKDYIYYDLIIAGNDTFACTFGISLSTGDAVRVYSSTNTLSFNAFGQESA